MHQLRDLIRDWVRTRMPVRTLDGVIAVNLALARSLPDDTPAVDVLRNMLEQP